MAREIVPSYLPAAEVTFTHKATGDTKKVWRPYAALPLAELKARAASDESGSLLELGERYHFGWGGAEQDYETAYAYLKRAAEKNVQDAIALLAGYYISDEAGILPRDPAKAVEMLTLAAEHGSWRAMDMLSAGYRTGGEGFPVDHEKAYAWAEDAERMIRIYFAFYTQKDFIDFTPVLKELLHAHTRMTCTLSACCADGVGVKRDLDMARRWLDVGEAYVCTVTGLAEVPVFQERRKALDARVKKDAARAEKAAKDAAKKK